MKFSDLKDIGQGIVRKVNNKIENIDVEPIKEGIARFKGNIESAVNDLADRLSEKIEERSSSDNSYSPSFGLGESNKNKDNSDSSQKSREEINRDTHRFKYSSKYRISSRKDLTEYQKDIFYSLIDLQFYNMLGINNAEFNQLFSKLMEYSNQQVCKKIFLIIYQVKNGKKIFSNANGFEMVMEIASSNRNEIDEALYEYLKENQYGLTVKELNSFGKKVLTLNVKYLFIDEEHDEIIEKINTFSERDERILDNLINSIEDIKTSDEKRSDVSSESIVDRASQAISKEKENKRKEDIRSLIKSFNERCDNELKRTIFDNLLNTVIKKSIDIEKAKMISDIIVDVPDEKLSKIDFDELISMFYTDSAYLINSDKAEEYLKLVFNPKNSESTMELSYKLCLNDSFINSENGKLLLTDISSLTIKNGENISKNLLKILSKIFMDLDFNKINKLENDPIKIFERVIMYISSSIESPNIKISKEDSDFIEDVVVSYIIDKLNLLKNIKSINKSVRIYDSFYDVNSYVLNSFPNTSLSLYGYVTDYDKKDIKSSFLVNENDKAIIIYTAQDEFLSKMNTIQCIQVPSIIKCSEEIIARYVVEYNLIAKYKEKYCNIPVTPFKTVNKNIMTIKLPDDTLIEVDLNSSTIDGFDPRSEIMNDINRQIICNSGKTLKQF